MSNLIMMSCHTGRRWGMRVYARKWVMDSPGKSMYDTQSRKTERYEGLLIKICIYWALLTLDVDFVMSMSPRRPQSAMFNLSHTILFTP